jgi:hypothetical protein
MKTLDETLDLLDVAVSEMLQKAGELGVKEAGNTDLFKTSDNFRNKIITQPTSKTSQVVWSTAPYSSYLEYGNNSGGPFIYPTKAKALHFFVNGEEVFAKKVHSHGPLPYMSNAKEVVESQLINIWEQVKKDIF